MAIHGVPLGFVEVVTNFFCFLNIGDHGLYIYIYIYIYFFFFPHHVGYLPQNSPEKFF